MVDALEQLLADYNYSFPPEAVASTPASPRDSAKLLVYDRAQDTVTFDIFRNVGQYLPPHATLVLNDTKVIPARLRLQRPTGGVVEVLYVGTQSGNVVALCNKKLANGSSLLRGETPLFTVNGREDGHYLLTPHFPADQLLTVLEQWGETPLPPYLKHSPLNEAQRRVEYQTVFARAQGSVAAPTASLHFTPQLLAELASHEVALAYVTLHVNLGTFAPLTATALQTGALHEEQYSIAPAAASLLNSAHEQGRPIIPVGTTALRTLESAVAASGSIAATQASTSLFIQPGYTFKVADGLITNFHVPRSSLLMLVAALTGREKLLSLYEQAIARGFRLFSFGDAMFIK